MKKKCTLLFVMLMISNFLVNAQNDFRQGSLVTNKNDTLKGLIHYTSNIKKYSVCKFKINEQVVKYFPSDIKKYTFLNDDKSYLSGIMENSFVEVLVSGKLSLYRYNDVFFLKKDGKVHKLESKDHELQNYGIEKVVKNNRWKGILFHLISDCKAIDVNMKNYRFQERFLIKVISEYNICKGDNLTVYKKDKSWNTIKWGVMLDVERTELEVGMNAGGFEFVNPKLDGYSVGIGALLDISFPRVVERFSIQPEIHLTKVDLKSTQVKEYLTYTRETRSEINYLKLSIPLLFKYNIPKEKYSFFIQSGLSADLLFNREAEFFSKIITDDQTFGNEQIPFELPKSSLGFMGGIGYKRQFKSFAGAIALNYHVQKMKEDRGNDIDNKRFSLSLIFYPKK